MPRPKPAAKFSDIMLPPWGSTSRALQPIGAECGQHPRQRADAVALRRVALDDVEARPHAAVAREIDHVLDAEQVLAGRHRAAR